jgi:BMFP domain-containing protein YqiC
MASRVDFDELSQRLMSLLPPGVEALTEDVKKNLRAVLSSALARMDLVTREEFDAQSALLSRTRMKLEALEKQVAQLEATLLKRDGGSSTASP